MALQQAVLNAMPRAEALGYVACASGALEPEHRLRPSRICGIGQDFGDVPFQDAADRREDVAASPDLPVGTYVDGCIPKDAGIASLNPGPPDRR